MIVFYLTIDGIYFEQYGHMKLQKGVLGTLVIVLFSTPDVGAEKAKREEKNLFILSGQSNMAGMDESLTFTPAVTKAFGENGFIGRISDAGLDNPKRLAGRLNIRKVQKTFAEAHPRETWVDTDDLNNREVEGKVIHDLHYSKKGIGSWEQDLQRRRIV